MPTSKKTPTNKPRARNLPLDPSTEQLVRSSGLIFSGTVVERGKSTVPTLPSGENLVVVRVDRGLRVDPVLGDLQGRTVTLVAQAPETLAIGQRAVFFTNSWIHGQGIAVRESEHRDLSEADAVAAVVAQLPQLHLRDRLRSAALVVDAEVVKISHMPRTSYERNAALWAAADLRVKQVLRGEAHDATIVYFPTAARPPWTNAPRFREGQHGIFVLHSPSQNATLSERMLETGALVALDPADFQPESQLPEIKGLLAAIE
jgi:hypothetical protein